MTKDELVKENNRLEGLLEATNRLDEKQRKEFAKIFNWMSSKPFANNEPATPSWPEIFAEIGRLQTSQDIASLHEGLALLDKRISDVASATNDIF